MKWSHFTIFHLISSWIWNLCSQVNLTNFWKMATFFRRTQKWTILSYLNFKMAHITHFLYFAKSWFDWLITELRKTETWTKINKVTRLYSILFAPILQWKLGFEKIFNVYLWKMVIIVFIQVINIENLCVSLQKSKP